MNDVHSLWQCATYLFLFPLIAGFIFAGASAFTAAYSRRFGERGGTIITAILRNLLGIPLLTVGYVWAWLMPSQWIFTPNTFLISLGWIFIIAGSVPLVVGHIYVGMRSHLPSVRDTLVHHGLYAYIRHPIYAGGLLMLPGVVRDKGAYWYRSPHPTVYRAQREGALTVAGRTYRFNIGNDIVFQCRMERDERKEDPGPVLIAHLQPTQNAVLCSDMSSAMKTMGGME